jgi:hypothetical protein
MSVLSFPRIYFKGMMSWDPCTFNNNDWQEFPTYDGVNAALNWPFLATQNITPQNFPTTFRPWAIALQPDCVDSPGGQRVPAEWNMFGTHGVAFVQQPGYQTTITGGALAYNQPVTSDPLIGLPVAITGDGGGAGRLVDTNPASFWSSQIYFASLAFGSGDCVISGPRNYRMHSRWLDLKRIYTNDQALTQPAASVGACFQTCIPYDKVQWPAASVNSKLALQLQQAAQTSPAIGIMVRFTAYVNVYFKNGILNNFTPTPRTYEDLAAALTAAWNEFNSTGKTDLFFSNPCYSHIVGVLGVWNEGEVATAPVGRFLAATNPVAAIGTTATAPVPAPGGKQRAAVDTAAAPPQVPLGPIVAYVDNNVISLDLNSTMPENGTPGEWPSDLSKANFGSLDLGVISNGTFTPVAPISYDQYARAAYESSAGIIDIALQSPLPSGPLAIQVQQPSGAVTALQEQELTAQTDTRGIYIDQRGNASFDVSVYDYGALSSGTNVLIAQYDQSLTLIPASSPPLVVFTNGDQTTITSAGGDITTTVTVLTTDSSGVASPEIAAFMPGFAVLAFFPYTGTTLPNPPDSLFPTITAAFYTTVRVLPFDDGVPQQFVDLWNASQNQTLAWQFIYNNILYLYDMIFNVMLTVFNLGDQSAVVGAIPYIWPVVTAEAAKENTKAMPITRDMSAGKRKTLQLWMYLVTEGYSVPDFNVDSIPDGWAPPPPKK